MAKRIRPDAVYVGRIAAVYFLGAVLVGLVTTMVVMFIINPWTFITGALGVVFGLGLRRGWFRWLWDFVAHIDLPIAGKVPEKG